MSSKEEIQNEPMGSIDFAVKVKGIIVAVYSDGTEEPAQRVGKLYNDQLNIFKKSLTQSTEKANQEIALLREENERLREDVEHYKLLLLNYGHEINKLK